MPVRSKTRAVASSDPAKIESDEPIRSDTSKKKGGEIGMKLFCLATSIGLGMALSVGAQTTTDEQQQQPAQPKGKAKVEQSTGVQENVSTGTVEEKGEVKAKASKQGGSVSQSTTVFRHGQQTSERLSLRRSVRERTDTHFSIGIHPRDWWLRTYSIVLLDGCHYYLADDGCWYPAYGFDPSCDYPPGVVFCD